VFRDRGEAGRVLAGRLAAFSGRRDVIVLGLARGGVPVAREIAATLHAPVDVFVVRKLGVPRWRELAMGAVASGGCVVLNDDLIRSLGITTEQVNTAIAAETDELHRRESAYRGKSRSLDLAAKVVILVDDGIATGASMLAAVRAVRMSDPARVVVVVPVAPRTVDRRLLGEADDIVVAVTPLRFEAVGQVFADFHQVSDDEVREALADQDTGPSPCG
jgi:putative phosphoribosyl transferase